MEAEKPLRGQVVLVTGGGRGLGRECALTAGQAGASVAIAATTEAELQAVADEISSLGVAALPIRADVSSIEDTERMVRETVSALGGLDILINAAAVDGPRGPLHELDLEVWQRAFAVNVTGVFLCCRAAIPEMLKRGRGHIINFSSSLVRRVVSNAVCYGATKSAVEGITRGLAAQLADHGIRVHSFSPGRVDTKNFPASRSSPEGLKELRPPEAIRESLLFLLTNPDALPSGGFLNVPDWDQMQDIE